MRSNSALVLVTRSGSGVFENGKSTGIESPYPKKCLPFRYIKDEEKENLSLPAVVEFFLNYAQKEDVKALFKIVGIDKVRGIFFSRINKSERVANNYFPVTRNFFKLYFQKYTLGNS